MRAELEKLANDLDWVSADSLTAVEELKAIISEILKHIDNALPIDKSNDV